ncbi:hypothetical protein DFJ73DRAFT_811369 [Zopfochytrium polystomum]|nr:hypothetical protein DFJ73DRAFT_811369 [Zopfochytrium polystomum]
MTTTMDSPAHPATDSSKSTAMTATTTSPTTTTPSTQPPADLAELRAFLSLANKTRPPLCPSPVDLGKALVLRAACDADADEVADFNGVVHDFDYLFATAARVYFPDAGDDDDDGTKRRGVGRPIARPAAAADNDSHPRIRRARKPTTDPSCLTIVRDTAAPDAGVISSVTSIPQILLYGDPGDDAASSKIPLLIVRPEAVGTREAYRGHRLIEHHMRRHHAWAVNALGTHVLLIGGIDTYYRRFGYEQAPPRFCGRGGSVGDIPPLRKGVAAEEFAVRPAVVVRRPAAAATETHAPDASTAAAYGLDCAFLEGLWRDTAATRMPIVEDIPAEWWADIIDGRIPGSFTDRRAPGDEAAAASAVETPTRPNDEPERVGFFQMDAPMFGTSVIRFEVDPDRASFVDVTPALLRWLPTYHREYIVPYQADAAKAEAAEKARRAKISGAAAGAVDPSQPQKEDHPAPAPALVSAGPPPLPPTWSFELKLGSQHPALASVDTAQHLPRGPRRAASWYSRVPSLTRFALRVQPVLERRVRRAAAVAGFSGALAVVTRGSRFGDLAPVGGGGGREGRNGDSWGSERASRATVFRFRRGRIVAVEDPAPGETLEALSKRFGEGGADAAAGPLEVVVLKDEVVSHLVFGYKSLDEVRALHLDVNWTPLGGRLFDVMFPKMTEVDGIFGLD